MKTTKKGFTLIELIVVIAIIGVLAAILVPTMLGYVRKSKISSANSTASSVYKAINSALTELDEEGIDIGGSYQIYWNTTKWSSSNTSTTTPGSTTTGSDKLMGAADNSTAMESLNKKTKNFFADITKVKSAGAQITDGNCVAVATATDSSYTGTYPAGIVTSDSYASYKPTTAGKFSDAALNAAVAKAGVTSVTG